MPAAGEEAAILRAQLAASASSAFAAPAGKKSKRKAPGVARGARAGAATATLLRQVSEEAAQAALRAEGLRVRMQQRPFVVEKGCASAQRVAARLAAKLGRR